MHPSMEKKELTENVVFIKRKETEAEKKRVPDTKVYEPDISNLTSQSRSKHYLKHHHPK